MFTQYAFAEKIELPASSVSVAPSPDDKTVYLEAQTVNGKKDSQLEASGKVEVQQGSQKIFADHVIYEPDSGDLFANGAVRMEQPGGSASGPALKTNTKSHVSEMATPVFEVKPDKKKGTNRARGSARGMHSPGNLFYVYDHVTYTTCPPGNDDWLLHVNQLDIDRATQMGTAHHAWIEFENVPILYTPWLSFPLDGARHTGFLAPIYGTSYQNGIELTIPFYWNIAPNYDYTVALRNMTKRGKMVKQEFRFAGDHSTYGEFRYDNLAHDHITNTSRFHETFSGFRDLGNGFRSTVKLDRVSDDNYFRDLSVAIADVTQTQLLNEGVVTYNKGWLTGSVRAQTFQTLQDSTGSVAIPYQRMPQINLSGQKTLNAASFNMVDEFVDFRHPTQAEGQRMVLYPSITYALLSDPGYYLKSKFGVNYAQYKMGGNHTNEIPNATRTLPIFSLDSGLTLERDMSWGKNEYVQTIEPRFFYVRIPYQNQDALPVFDTTPAGLSFSQMFSEMRFYGNDRIGDADMATVGLTSRVIDSDGGIERLHVTAAERYNYTMPIINPELYAKSDILVSIGGRVTNSITVDSLFDYNPNEKYTSSGIATISYKPETGKLMNLGYHFTRNILNSANDVRQVDFSTQWPLWWHWSSVARAIYSLPDQLLTQRLLGLEYNQSCWTFRLVSEVFTTSTAFSTYAFYMQLELNDLVAVGNNPIDELKMTIPGYTKLNDPKLNPAMTGTDSP